MSGNKNNMIYGISGLFNSEGVDWNGAPVSRSRSGYPYSYDPYVTYRGGTNDEAKETVYSDRLFQWDSAKYDKCCKDVWGNEGQYFDSRSPQSIERFLQLYLDKPKLKLIGIMQGANMSSGYPYWIFFFNSEPTPERSVAPVAE